MFRGKLQPRKPLMLVGNLSGNETDLLIQLTLINTEIAYSLIF